MKRLSKRGLATKIGKRSYVIHLEATKKDRLGGGARCAGAGGGAGGRGPRVSGADGVRPAAPATRPHVMGLATPAQ